MKRAALPLVVLSRPVRRASLLAFALATCLHTVVAGQQAGTNVNMVKGTTKPYGDPYLQRQTEPTLAVSTRNPCHILGSAVDYRTVDQNEATSDTNPTQLATGDAWLGLYKSFDCGQRFQSELIPGWLDDTSENGNKSPLKFVDSDGILKRFDAAADGVVRAGSNGLFYYVGMVFMRDERASQVFVARYIDNNNKERGDTIDYAGTTVVARGGTKVLRDGTSSRHFLDKPWLAVDIPRRPAVVTRNDDKPSSRRYDRDDDHFGRGEDHDNDGMCVVNGQRVPAGNVYVAWTNFDLNAATSTSRLMFARSTSCGRRFEEQRLFEKVEDRRGRDSARERERGEGHGEKDDDKKRAVQGASIAIAPDDGTVYVSWRQFAGPGVPNAIYFVRSTDGGKSFSAPKQLAVINPFDQPRGRTTFRTNTMPTMAADHLGHVFVAWAERGLAANPARKDVLTGDSRIVMAVSSDRGRTWAPRYPIDDAPLGHQVMPSLSVGGGKLHAMWYDFREDPCLVSPANVSASCGAVADATGSMAPFYQYIDGIDHLFGVRSALAAPGGHPTFTSASMSQYQTGFTKDGAPASEKNRANLPLYAAGTRSFLGDYIDAGALTAVPTRPSRDTQQWVPNTGALTVSGGRPDPTTAPMSGFMVPPVFHGVWTDMRDVIPPLSGDWSTYYPPKSPSFPPIQGDSYSCNPDTTGMRNANIYTSRVTQGMFAGTPGNAKPLGFVTRGTPPVRQHLQRAFVVFVQNALRQPRYYRLKIMNQPGTSNTDRASFKQFPAPPYKALDPSDKLHDPRIAPITELFVSVPPISTVSRTVYVTAADPNAQVRIDVEETEAPSSTTGTAPLSVKPGGMRSSILLNPDATAPPLEGADVVVDVPDIALLEVHEPVINDPIFYDIANPGKLSTLRVRTPADQNPADQNPADQNVTELFPADQNPADQNPADQNGALEAVAFSEADPATLQYVRDINFVVNASKANTTTRYLFRPVVATTRTDLKYQLLVTIRNNTLVADKNCNLKFQAQNQVLVNISDYQPRTPADQNQTDQTPADQNPADQNPADQNSAFFLAPGDQATVTLRVYSQDASTPADPLPTPNVNVGAVLASTSANTGEIAVPTVAGGPDLIVSEPPAHLDPAAVAPGEAIDLTWTLKNRGTATASSSSGSIATKFYLSTNSTFATTGDVELFTSYTTAGLPACTTASPTICAASSVQPLIIPRTTAPGAFFIKIVTDPGDEVFEADNGNNVAVIPITVVPFTVGFTQAPSRTTQDYLIGSTTSPTVMVSVTDSHARPVSGFAVTLAVAAGSPAGALAGTTTVNDAGGTATFSNLSINNAGAGYRLVATAVDLTPAPPNATPVTSGQFSIDVDAPPVVANDAYSINEDGTLGVDTTQGVLTNDSDAQTFGTPPPDRGALTAAISTVPANGTVAINANGSFTYTPSHDFNGTDSFIYTARDGRPGNDRTGTVTITVVPVNDPPSFMKGPNQSLLWNAGAQTVPGWATAISAGPANESAQALNFIVTNNNNAMFSAQPAISPTGTLTFTTAPNASGVAIVTVQLHDNGGTANGGQDTSSSQTFSITTGAPLVLTTTSLSDGVIFENYNACLSTSGSSQGTRTFSITAGSLPPGVGLNATNTATPPSNNNAGCFTGSPTALGTFSFTAQVTDQSSPPQVDQRPLSIHVSAPDQSAYSIGASNPISFGGSSGHSFAQTATVGATGSLVAIGFGGNVSCSGISPTIQLMVEIQDVTPISFQPNGVVRRSGTGNWYNRIALSSPLSMAKGERFAVVISITGDCQLNNQPTTDTYILGEGFERTGNGAWQRLADAEGKPDITFRTLIVPSANLAFFAASRNRQTATVLTCPGNSTCAWGGKVLQTGSYNLNTADVYDPSTHTVTSTGNMSEPRQDHTATLLTDGTVLVVGGWNPLLGEYATTARTATAQTYDPSTGTFTSTANNLFVARSQHTATLLNNGKVLITGGFSIVGGVGQTLRSAELYDPATRTFTLLGDIMIGSRSEHTATLLGNGKVLLVGGNSNGPWPVPNGETFDPNSNSFAAISGPITNLRTRHTATLLGNGMVLVAGGIRYPNMETVAELYDPATNSLSATGTMGGPRADHTATLLTDETVLFAGGVDQPNWPNEPIASLERYDLATGTFTTAGSTAVNRSTHRAAAVAGGKVALLGGYSASQLAGHSVELYDPATALVVSPAQLSDSDLGVGYSANLTSSGGAVPRTLSLLSGTLPDGLGFTASAGAGTASISGTPTARGTFPFAVQVTDAVGHTNVQPYTIRIGTPVITSPYQLPEGTQGQSYSYQLTGSGGDGAFTWALDPIQNNGLPPTLTLSSGGLINGTTTAQGYFQFVVLARDLAGQTAMKPLSINVPNHSPTANWQSVTTNEDTSKAITLTGSDPEGSALTFSIMSPPQHGSLSGTAPNMTYTPAANYKGSDSFAFKANDGRLDSNVATVNITINPVNDAPIAVADSYLARQNGTLTVVAFVNPRGVLFNDSDVDSASLTAVLVSGPAPANTSSFSLSSDGGFSYTPATDFYGPVTFTYQASDGLLLSNIATVTITVSRAPTAQTDAVTTSTRVPLVVNVLANDTDPDGDPLTVIAVASPTTAFGSAVRNVDNTITYTAAAGFVGADSFTYTISDPSGGTATGTVMVTVTAKGAAIIRNFCAGCEPDVRTQFEIGKIQAYLADLGIASHVFDQEGLTFTTSNIGNFDLVIWDDQGDAAGGLTDNDVSVLKIAAAARIPVYLIGDDLAVSLSAGGQTDWRNLLKLNASSTTAGSVGTVTIANPDHPVTNGPFGIVSSFPAFIDADATTATGTGEVVLAKAGTDDVVVAFDDPVNGRTVSQNVLIWDNADGTGGNVERMKLFKNAVTWLMGPRTFDVVLNMNVTSGGFGGMRGNGTGTVSIADIPLGSVIKKALLHWNGPTSDPALIANANVTFAGAGVIGTNIGVASSNCWDPLTRSYSYVADVTSLVSGNGSYPLANFWKSSEIEVNGASLTVFYDDPSSTTKSDVYIFQGNDSNIGSVFEPGNWSQTFRNVRYTAGQATVQLNVSDGQSFFDGGLSLNDSEFLAAGSIFEGDSVPNGPGGFNGGLWDIKRFDVTSKMAVGTFPYTLFSPIVNDCLSVVVGMLAVPHVP